MSDPPPAPILVFVGVDVLTMEDPEPLRDRTVRIRDGRIESIEPRSARGLPAHARVVDARGRFLTPGLVDAHIHLRHADAGALAEYLRAGVTSAREMNGRPGVLEWRDRIEAGELAGPRLRVAAPTLGNWSSPREGYATPETNEQGSEAVRRFEAEGYDWIKVYSFLPAAAFAGVIEEAERLGIPVGGHVPIEVGLRRALASGLGSIEHLTEYVGSALTPEERELDESDLRSVFGAGTVDWAVIDALVAETVASGAWNVPTLVWFDRNLPTSRAQEAWADAELRAQGETNRREIVRRLHEAGARLAVGTDSDAGDQLEASAIHDEIAAMVEAGITAADVLRMATLAGATLLELDDEVGTIRPGKQADLLLLPCDPRLDLACLRQPEMVLSRGRVVIEAKHSDDDDALRPRAGQPVQ